MELLSAALVFILGASIGSFLSVVIYRIHTGQKEIILSRSMCPKCKKTLKWMHLIPLLSWLILRGRCAYCREKISVHYFILEVLTGLSFLACFFKWNFLEIIPSPINADLLNYSINWETFGILIYYLIIFSILIGIFFYDLFYKEIPDRLSLTAIAVAIAGGLIFGTVEPLSMLMGGVAIFLFFAIQFFISKGTWIGGGDLRLGAFIGVFLGFEKGLVALISAYILGSIISVFLILSKRATRKSKIPFGPFLAIGIIIAVFYGEQILNWYLTRSIFLSDF